MDILLTDNEVRVLGCLMEKEMATPEYYPLTLNALVNACNQKSNRNPVVSFEEETVLHALSGLQETKLVRKSNVSRVPKYEQIFTAGLNLLGKEAAIICILLLRGPQTVGEIRGRTERMHQFAGLDEVQQSLSSLDEMELVARLPRQPGRKESRYAHLLSGQPSAESENSGIQEETPKVVIRREGDRVGELEKQVECMRLELENLKLEFADFKSQFE